MNNISSEIISTRQTFDGVTVHLHADGSVSDRLNHIKGGKLPTATMWRVWEDICTYTHAEIPALIREVKRGTWAPVRIRQTPTTERFEAIRSKQVQRCAFNSHGVLVWY